jgi:hypothetical protein
MKANKNTVKPPVNINVNKRQTSRKRKPPAKWGRTTAEKPANKLIYICIYIKGSKKESGGYPKDKLVLWLEFTCGWIQTQG